MNNDREEYLSLKRLQESFKTYQNVLKSKTIDLNKINEALDDYCSSVKSFQISWSNIDIKKLLTDEILVMHAKQALRNLCYDCEKHMAENGVRCPFRSISNEFCDNYNFLYFIINFKKEDINNE